MHVKNFALLEENASFNSECFQYCRCGRTLVVVACLPTMKPRRGTDQPHLGSWPRRGWSVVAG